MTPMDRISWWTEAGDDRTRSLPWMVGVIVLAIGLSVVMPGCASAPTDGAEPDVRRELSDAGRSSMLSDSELDITYVLGHDLHRFVARAKDRRILGRTFLDRELLKKNAIDEKRYSELFEKVVEFVENPAHEAPDALGSCRTPFTVRVRAGGESITTSGCRTSEMGMQLSQLARDAEFLLLRHR
jgi:hypothetical protein